MEKIDEVPEIDEFLTGPLVNWFESCLETITDEKLTYEGLVDGVLMHNVFLQMNLQVHDTNVYPSTLDSAACRSRNLAAVLDNVRRFYEDELGQVTLRVPDVEKLGREPEYHVREIELLLGLLLGCAVQCPKKERFIERIMRLDEASRLGVAECIAKVMNVPGIVLSTDMFGDSANAQKAIDCVRQICQERDEYKMQLRRRRELEDERLSDDLCEKSQLRLKTASLEEQLRQKCDALEDAEDELKEREEKLRELTRVHDKLVFDNKNVTYYRDELKVATEKIEQLEQEVLRYQKKLSDFDHCRTRLEELDGSNKALTQNKVELMKQIASSKKTERDKMRDLSRQVTKQTEQTISNLTVENAENCDKYWTVCEEKSELHKLRLKASYKNHSDGEPRQLQNDKENPLAKLDQALRDKSTLMQANKKLLQMVEALNVNYKREVNKSKALEYHCKKALNEAKKLQQQELENLKSLLEKAQKGGTSRNPVDLNNSLEVSNEQQYNVVRSRKLLKYVKTQT